jgi:diguanylate cyclase (GGDEF)-like protein/PAS domain S-box-containing protein
MSNQYISQTNSERPSRVLIVDDDVSMRSLVKTLLANCGYELMEATSGEQALQYIKEQPFDVILLDISLPAMDGIEVCTRLRSDPRNHHLAIIMLTATTDVEHINRAFAAGATDYVTKPIHPLGLTARVQAAVERARTQYQLWANEQRVRAVLDNLPEGIVTINPHGIIETFNVSAERMFGFKAEEVVGKKINTLMPEPYKSEHDGYMENYLRTGQAHIIGIGPREVTGQHKDGKEFPIELGISELNMGALRIFIGIVRDVTERKRFEQRLQYAADHDPLTGVFNRRYFMEQLTIAMSAAVRHHSPLSVCMSDLDKFKMINDQYGHAMGDRVLAEFGKLVSHLLRAEDVAGRYGGDEFCFAFPNISAKNAKYIVERIRTELGALVFTTANGETFTMAGTFGIAELDSEIKTIEQLMANADQALYTAKQLGRDRTFVYDRNDAAR